MKSIKFVIPLMAVLALALFLSGCPKDKMMSGDGMEKDGMQKEEMMDKQ